MIERGIEICIINHITRRSGEAIFYPDHDGASIFRTFIEAAREAGCNFSTASIDAITEIIAEAKLGQ